MGALCKGILVTLIAIGLVCIHAPLVYAYQQYGVGQDILLFGALNQHDVDVWNNPGSNSCGPTAATNTFVYLENRFPGVYGNALVPLNGSDPYADMASAARNIYNNYMYTAAPPGGTTTRNFAIGLTTYIDERVPGVSAYKEQNPIASSTAPDWVQRVYPTWDFLYDELKAGAGVDVNIWWSSGGHYISLSGFKWDDLDNDSVMDYGEGGIGFMDPWTGAYGRTYVWHDNVNDRLATGYYPSGVTSSWIAMAIAISPVPEPSLVLLLEIGLLGIVGMKKKDLEGKEEHCSRRMPQ